MSEAEPADPAEPGALVAIERATAAFARAFPYLGWRYGEPGLHDARDDNAQLLAAANNHPDALGRQVAWIAEQMTLRGQPRWMLEIQLELLARAAPSCVPARGAQLSATLRGGAYSLDRERRATMTEGKFRRAGLEFADRLGFGPSRLWRGFGHILCAAVIDERRGFETAVVRVRTWAVDPHHFGQPWIDVVEASITAFRRL